MRRIKAYILFPGTFSVLLSVFGPLKNDLATVCYPNDDEEKNATSQWFNQVGQNLFDTGNEKLVPRCEKVLNKLGYYIEKCLYFQIKKVVYGYVH